MRKLIEQELEDGEQVRWIGMPVPTFITSTSIGLFLFAIPWTTISLAVGFGPILMGFFADGTEEKLSIFSVVFLVFTIPFLGIGIAFLSSPIWVYYKALKTVYAITDQRAITVDWGWSTTIRSYTPEKLQDIYRKQRGGGIGDLIIDRKVWQDSDGNQSKQDLGFLRIDNVKQVERMLKDLVEGQKSRHTAPDELVLPDLTKPSLD